MEHILKHFKDNNCVYCHHSLEKESWSSEWGSSAGHHYKILHCSSCRKKNWLNVNFDGSGHDGVLKQEWSSLESTLRKVAER